MTRVSSLFIIIYIHTYYIQYSIGCCFSSTHHSLSSYEKIHILASSNARYVCMYVCTHVSTTILISIFIVCRTDFQLGSVIRICGCQRLLWLVGLSAIICCLFIMDITIWHNICFSGDQLIHLHLSIQESTHSFIYLISVQWRPSTYPFIYLAVQ